MPLSERKATQTTAIAWSRYELPRQLQIGSFCMKLMNNFSEVTRRSINSSQLIFSSDSLQLASTADLFIGLNFILAKATTAKKLIANLHETNLLQSSLMEMVSKISLIQWEKL